MPSSVMLNGKPRFFARSRAEFSKTLSGCRSLNRSLESAAALLPIDVKA